MDHAVYGRITKAYQRGNGALLLLYRPRSRNAQWHDRIGTWMLIEDDLLIALQHIYGRPVRSVPIRWANSMLHKYRMARGDRSGRLWNGGNGAATTGAQAIDVLPLELPAALVGFYAGTSDLTSSLPIDLPIELPNAPPHRLFIGKSARCILSRAEYDLYLETWNHWMQDYSGCDAPQQLADLKVICMETVLQHRLLGVMGRDAPTGQLAKRYHSSMLRLQRARLRLGATRRQRLSECPDSAAARGNDGTGRVINIPKERRRKEAP